MDVFDKLFSTVLFKNKIFKDETTLLRDFIPAELPCREAELGRFARAFRPLRKGKSVNMLITGKPGSGKTCLTKYCCARFESLMMREKRKFKTVYYNCFVHKSRSSLATSLLGHFQINSRGLGFETGISLLKRRLDRENSYLTMILDEGQYLPYSDLQAFLELVEQFKENRMSVVVIMRTGQDRIIKLMKQGTIYEEIQLSNYSKDDLIKILSYRAGLAFQKFPANEVLDLVSTIAANTHDARHGIEILYHAGKLAEQRGLADLSLDLIREAKIHVYPEIALMELDTLEPVELLICLSVARTLKEQVFTNPKEVYKNLKVLSEEFNVELIDFRRFNMVLNRLIKRGFFERGYHPKREEVIESQIESREIPTNFFEARIIKKIEDQLR